MSFSRRDVNKDLLIKNSGPGTLDLFGLPRKAGVTSLPPGHQIVVPLMPTSDLGPQGDLHSELLSGLLVITGSGGKAERTAKGLLLSGVGPGDSVANVGGARIVLRPSFSLHIARPTRTTSTDSSRVDQPEEK